MWDASVDVAAATRDGVATIVEKERVSVRRSSFCPMMSGVSPKLKESRPSRLACCAYASSVPGVGSRHDTSANPTPTHTSLTQYIRLLIGREETIESLDTANRGYDRSMILVAVDDFLFRSKIRATGKQAGVELTFAKTPAEMLEQARTLKPTLAIFDLNSAAMAPIETIAAMKQDPALSSIRTMGFVSHVNVTRINAARQAGVDEVLARSAFAGNLGDILMAAGVKSL